METIEISGRKFAGPFKSIQDVLVAIGIENPVIEGPVQVSIVKDASGNAAFAHADWKV